VTGSQLNLCLACREVQPDSAGGLARATRDLAQALAQEGHAVHLLTNSSPAELFELPGVSVIPVLAAPASGRFDDPQPDTAPENLLHAAAVYREVRRIHEQDRPVDAVVAPLWRSEGAICALDERFLTIVSCMTSLQTLIEVDPAYRLIDDIEERLGLEREALRQSRFLHGLTEAALIKTISDHELAPEATVVIGRGLCDRGIPARMAGAVDGPVRVLFVGRLEHRKGVDTLLTAARELIESGVEVEFTLAGPNANPSYRDAFEREASGNRRLRERVRFTGQVSDAELMDLYAESDIVCQPSRYESHGIVLLEAMMSARPILTCDVGGIGEVITPGRDALAVAPDDARALAAGLRRLIAEPSLRARLGAAGRETFVARFDAKLAARRLQSFIDTLGELQRAPAGTSSDVGERLEALLDRVLRLDRGAAAQARQELLNPSRAALQRAQLKADNGALRAELEQLAAGADQLRSDLARAAQTIHSQASALTVLNQRNETLRRIEDGGWWRLRSRLLPLLRIAAWLRGQRRRPAARPG
jgi:glycosyltransferase involved in cell wall biosynthesis